MKSSIEVVCTGDGSATMNSEDFDLMMKKKSYEACVEFFAGAKEADRKLISERAMEWYEAACAFEYAGSPFVRAMLGFESQLPKKEQAQLALVKRIEKKELIFPREVQDKESVDIARLAVTASSALTEIRKVGMPKHEYAFEVMVDRKPKFLDKWLTYTCERSPNRVWIKVRQIERQGLAQAEDGDGYWLAMAFCLGQLDIIELGAFLEQDKEIVESLLWRMLENEAAVQLLSDPSGVNDQVRSGRRRAIFADWQESANRLEESRRASFNWKTAVVEMANKDLIPKEKLVPLIFEWLARLSGDKESKASSSYVTNTSPAQWFQQLHDELELSIQDRNSRATQYIGLLSVRDSSTLAWSLKQIAQCDLSLLPLADLLSNMNRVFYHKRKEAAQIAIQILEQLWKNNPSDLDLYAKTAVEAFEHPSGDIQKKAFSFLKKTKAIQNPEIFSLIEQKKERLSALMKKELADLMQATRPETSEPAGDGEETSEPFASNELDLRSDLEELLAQAKQITGVFADAAEISSCIAIVESDDSSRFPGPLELKSMDIPRLDQSKKIEPVQDLDALIFLYLHVLEGSASSDDTERLLDGLSRLCNQRPADFEDRVSSLRKKLQPQLENFERFDNFPISNLIIDLAGVARSWLGKKADEEKKPGLIKQLFGVIADVLPQEPIIALPGMPSPGIFLSVRAKALAKIVAKRMSLPLLAAPTHIGGWIDPLVLPERLKAWSDAGLTPDGCDIVQSLLRLAPENRTLALEKLPAGKQEYLRAFRWALGGEMSGDINSTDIWIAALRAREPYSSNEFLKQRFPSLGPDCAELASYVDRTEDFAAAESSIYGTAFNRQKKNSLPILPNPPVRDRSDIRFFPTELLHVSSVFHEAAPHIELYYPLYRESFFAGQTNRTALFLESVGNYWTTSWNCLFDSDVPLSGMGTWLLVVALTAKQPETSRLALDATIAGIDENRIDGPVFGQVMARFLMTGRITLVRWTNAFKEISRISPLHRQFAKDAIENCLAGLSEKYCEKAPIAFLEILYDCAIASKQSIENAACRTFLSQIKGKGKGSKLSKLLLELKDTGSRAHWLELNAQVLRSRIERVHAWDARVKTQDKEAVEIRF